MKIAKFMRCVCPSDYDAIDGWFTQDHQTSSCKSMFCITVTVDVDFTQQEMDDLTALAVGRFILVEFS